MAQNTRPISVEDIRAAHTRRKPDIRRRLKEFEDVWRHGSDERLWEELVFCIFTAGASARMGLRSIEAVRHLLATGRQSQLSRSLRGVHRFPISRSGYIVSTRDYLNRAIHMRLREKLASFDDLLSRRDWLANDHRVKGLGYKEASHFLRNIGFRGYAILDKHVLRSLSELGLIDFNAAPTSRARYLAGEEAFRGLARNTRIDFDELDLVLWSLRTGEILK